MAHCNCSILCRCLKQRTGSTSLQYFRTRIGWTVQLLPLALAGRDELCLLQFSFSWSYTDLSLSFPTSREAPARASGEQQAHGAQYCNCIIHWMHRVVGAVDLGIINKILLGQDLAKDTYSSCVQAPQKYFRFWIFFPPLCLIMSFLLSRDWEEGRTVLNSQASPLQSTLTILALIIKEYLLWFYFKPPLWRWQTEPMWGDSGEEKCPWGSSVSRRCPAGGPGNARDCFSSSSALQPRQRVPTEDAHRAGSVCPQG